RSADVMVRLEAMAAGDAACDGAAVSRILQGAKSMAAMVAAAEAAEQRRNAAAAAAGSGGSPKSSPSAAAGAGNGQTGDDDEEVAAALRAAGATPLDSADASETDDADDEGEDHQGYVGSAEEEGEFSSISTSTSADSQQHNPQPQPQSQPPRKPPPRQQSPHSETSPATTGQFETAWVSQLRREGLVGALVAAAYPDRIAERRERSNTRPAYTLASGQVVRLPSPDDPLGDFAYLAVADIGGVGSAAAAAGRRDGGTNDTVRAAAGLSTAAIERYLGDMVQDREVVFWASGNKSVVARRQRRLGCLVLGERAAPPTNDEAAWPALLQGFKEMGGIRGVGLSPALESWRQRVIWLRTQARSAQPTATAAAASSASPSSSHSSITTPTTINNNGKGTTNSTTNTNNNNSTITTSASVSSGNPAAAAARLASLPDLSDTALLAEAARWLRPHLAGVRSRTDIMKLDWNAILRSLVPWDLQPLVDSEAPSHLQLPTGSRAAVDYSRSPPCVRCRLQEVFGLPATPLLAGGRVPLQLELLSPAGRPVAVTSDLARFWSSTYPEVRRELRGRYPRHVWPDDPLQAEATRLTKKQLELQQERQQQQEGAAEGAAASGGGSGGKNKASGPPAGGTGGKKQSGGSGGKRR
ncbi:hypothetical protein Agub_g13645, partial [Astrephomene gubernaculifera]